MLLNLDESWSRPMYSLKSSHDGRTWKVDKTNLSTKKITACFFLFSFALFRSCSFSPTPCMAHRRWVNYRVWAATREGAMAPNGLDYAVSLPLLLQLDTTGPKEQASAVQFSCSAEVQRGAQRYACPGKQHQFGRSPAAAAPSERVRCGVNRILNSPFSTTLIPSLPSAAHFALSLLSMSDVHLSRNLPPAVTYLTVALAFCDCANTGTWEPSQQNDPDPDPPCTFPIELVPAFIQPDNWPRRIRR